MLKDEDVKVYAGEDALNQIVGIEAVDIVLTAIVGYAACRRNEEMAHKVNHLGTKNIISGLDGSQLLFEVEILHVKVCT